MPSSSTSGAAAVVVRAQRLGLPARAVEREHQLPAQPLAQRVLRDERLELATSSRACAEREVRVDALLQRVQAQLLEPLDLALRERLVREVGERRAAPERRAPRAAVRPLLGRRASRLATSGSNRARSSCARPTWSDIAGRLRHEPSAPSGFRSCETKFCSDVVAVRGGSSPQSGSTSRSTGTTRPRGGAAARAARAASGRRARPARPRRATSSGPRTRNSQHVSVLTLEPPRPQSRR